MPMLHQASLLYSLTLISYVFHHNLITEESKVLTSAQLFVELNVTKLTAQRPICILCIYHANITSVISLYIFIQNSDFISIPPQTAHIKQVERY